MQTRETGKTKKSGKSTTYRVNISMPRDLQLLAKERAGQLKVEQFNEYVCLLIRTDLGLVPRFT